MGAKPIDCTHFRRPGAASVTNSHVTRSSADRAEMARLSPHQLSPETGAATAGAGGRADARRIARLTRLGGSILVMASVLALTAQLADWAQHDVLDRVADLVLSAGTVLAGAVFYQGLTHWNRIATRTSQPGAKLNGLAAVLVVAALGNLIAYHLHGSVTGIDAAVRQVHVLAFGALIVVVGTCLSIASLARLIRDLRMWLFAGCSVVALAFESALQLTGLVQWSFRPVAWLILGLTILRIMRIKQVIREPVATSSTQPATVGALVVLVAAVSALIWAARSDSNAWPLTYAVAAAVMVCVRLFRMVQELESLALSRIEAHTDELTGAGNRRALTASLSAALASSGPVVVLIIDLDRFKYVNDRYGHAVGDQLLQHVTGLFSQLLPASASLARLGGDEFAICLQVEHSEAVTVAEDLVHAVRLIDNLNGLPMRLSVSIGISGRDEPRIDANEMIRRADVAMYLAKSRAEGVRAYDADLDAQAQEDLQLAEDLHVALSGEHEAGQVDVFFQPQIDSAGQVSGAEALVRWHHPRLGLLTPARFLDIAESNRLMEALTALVLRRSADEATKWAAAGHDLRVSVNLSASCLTDPGLIPLLDTVLAGSLPADRLVVELTESMVMQDPVNALSVIREITVRGVGLSIDDYGTGYSSLSYLDDLPATELKIDRSFTARVLKSPRTRAIVAATVGLAHRLQMRLVAEGVEDAATLAVLRELGCDETQGYLHSHPLSSSAFLDWLNQRQQGPYSAGHTASIEAVQTGAPGMVSTARSRWLSQ